MSAVFSMRMVMHPARPVVDEVRSYDTDYRRHQQPQLRMINNADGEEYKPNGKYGNRPETMMMPFPPVVKGITPNCKSNDDHKYFETNIIDQLYSE
jgi:hypothetical protein